MQTQTRKRFNRQLSSCEICSHILQNPLYKRVRATTECQNLLSMLGKNKSSLIKFSYIKNETLFIAVWHNVGLAELKNDFIINQIKSLLKLYVKNNENSKLKDVKDVKIFVAKSPKTQDLPQSQSVKPKVERASGNFKNLAKNSEIFAFFERLREMINANK